MACSAAVCGCESGVPWYAVLHNPCPIPQIVISTKQINIGRKIQSYTLQTVTYVPHPASQWLDWMKTYRVIIGITLGAAVVAACSYLQSGHTQRKRARKLKQNNSYYQVSRSNQSHEAQSHEIEESVQDKCSPNLRQHQVRRDKEEKTKEERLFGINLTDVSSNNQNRVDHEYSSNPSNAEEHDNSCRNLVAMSTEVYANPSDPETQLPPRNGAQPGNTTSNADNGHRLHNYTHLQRQSSFSSETTFSKRNSITIALADGQGHSSFTKETNVSSNARSTQRRRTLSFRRSSVGDILRDW